MPSDSMVVIAGSGKNLNPDDLIKNFENLKPATDYFTAYHLRDSLDADRIAYLEQILNRRVDINSDFNLLGFLYYS